jgi:hypothetical protein
MYKKIWLNILILLAYFGWSALPSFAQQWQTIKNNQLYGISGISLVEQKNTDATLFLVVHDNKKAGNTKLALVKLRGDRSAQYWPLKWLTDQPEPVDLEGLTTIPDSNTFMAMSSRGEIYHLQLDQEKKTVSVLQVFSWPNIPANSNFEGFLLKNFNGVLVAIATDRGDGRKPATIHWGIFDPVTYQIIPQGNINWQVPWPQGTVRHISDLKVDDTGVIFITAANDPGDDGPFQSAVYLAGVLEIIDQQINLRINPSPVMIYRFDQYKVEALELIPGIYGGLVFGSDDEKAGGSIFLSW